MIKVQTSFPIRADETHYLQTLRKATKAVAAIKWPPKIAPFTRYSSVKRQKRKA